MSEILRITSAKLADEQLVGVSREVCVALNDSNVVEASLHRGAAVASSRGDPITLGAIALSVLTGGTAVAALEVLKSFFERDASLEMTFEKDGRSMKVSSKNMTPSEIKGTLASAREFFDGSFDAK